MDSQPNTALEALIPSILPQLRQLAKTADPQMCEWVTALRDMLPSLEVFAATQTREDVVLSEEEYHRFGDMDETTLNSEASIDQQIALYKMSISRLRVRRARQERPESFQPFKPIKIRDPEKFKEQTAPAKLFGVQPVIESHIRLESLAGTNVEELLSSTSLLLSSSLSDNESMDARLQELVRVYRVLRDNSSYLRLAGYLCASPPHEDFARELARRIVRHAQDQNPVRRILDLTLHDCGLENLANEQRDLVQTAIAKLPRATTYLADIDADAAAQLQAFAKRPRGNQPCLPCIRKHHDDSASKPGTESDYQRAAGVQPACSLVHSDYSQSTICQECENSEDMTECRVLCKDCFELATVYATGVPPSCELCQVRLHSLSGDDGEDRDLEPDDDSDDLDYEELDTSAATRSATTPSCYPCLLMAKDNEDVICTIQGGGPSQCSNCADRTEEEVNGRPCRILCAGCSELVSNLADLSDTCESCFFFGSDGSVSTGDCASRNPVLFEKLFNAPLAEDFNRANPAGGYETLEQTDIAVQMFDLLEDLEKLQKSGVGGENLKTSLEAVRKSLRECQPYWSQELDFNFNTPTSGEDFYHLRVQALLDHQDKDLAAVQQIRNALREAGIEAESEQMLIAVRTIDQAVSIIVDVAPSYSPITPTKSLPQAVSPLKLSTATYRDEGSFREQPAPSEDGMEGIESHGVDENMGDDAQWRMPEPRLSLNELPTNNGNAASIPIDTPNQAWVTMSSMQIVQDVVLPYWGRVVGATTITEQRDAVQEMMRIFYCLQDLFAISRTRNLVDAADFIAQAIESISGPNMWNMSSA